MIYMEVAIIAMLFVIGLNVITHKHNKALWNHTEGLRIPNRRYTPSEMRALLETERAEKITKGLK